MPLPLPELPEVTVAKPELFVTLQEQPEEVITLKLLDPEPEPKFELYALNE